MAQQTPHQKNAPTPAPAETLSHQERVYFEMFRAIEQLGRKLEKAEIARDDLAQRLADIESSAVRDDKTGKLYLPVPAHLAPVAVTPEKLALRSRLTLAASLSSLCVALLAVFVASVQHAPSVLPSRQIVAQTQTADPAIVPAPARDVLPVWQKRAEADVAVVTLPTETAAEDTTIQSIEPAAAIDAQDSTDTEDTVWSEDAEAFNAHLETVLADVTTAPETAGAGSVYTVAAPPVNLVTHLPVTDIAVIDTPVAVAAAPAVVVVPEPAPVVVAAARARDAALPPALKALEARAYDGSAEAQHDLAALYAAGQRVRQDYSRAIYWFTRAADNGVSNASYNLGVMTQQGIGMKANMKQALAWYDRAALLGHAEAMYNLGLAYVDGRGVVRDTARGVAYFKRAANAGLMQAAYNLGVLYENGQAGGKDLDAAQDWYGVAASEGHEDAQEALERLNRQQTRAGALSLSERTTQKPR